MDVIGHQAVGPAGDAEAPAGFGEPVLVEPVVVGLKKIRSPRLPRSSDVMRQAGDDDAGDAGHQRSIAEIRQLANTGDRGRDAHC